MKPNRFYQKISHLALSIIALVLYYPAVAQIPQNIEVDGEPAKLWDYAVNVLVLGVITLAIFIIARIFKKPRK